MWFRKQLNRANLWEIEKCLWKESNSSQYIGIHRYLLDRLPEISFDGKSRDEKYFSPKWMKTDIKYIHIHITNIFIDQWVLLPWHSSHSPIFVSANDRFVPHTLSAPFTQNRLKLISDYFILENKWHLFYVQFYFCCKQFASIYTSINTINSPYINVCVCVSVAYIQLE